MKSSTKSWGLHSGILRGYGRPLHQSKDCDRGRSAHMKLLLTLLLVALSSVASSGRAQRGSAAPTVEDIYVVRSVRTSRVRPTDFCTESRTGFGSPTFEDRYDFHATTTRPSDGKMTVPLGGRVGRVHGCFGETS